MGGPEAESGPRFVTRPLFHLYDYGGTELEVYTLGELLGDE